MQFSRMRTARLLTISRSSIRIVGGSAFLGGLPSEGGLPVFWGGGCLSSHVWHCGNADPPDVDRMTDR